MEDLIEDKLSWFSHPLTDSEALLKMTLEELYASLVTWNVISPSVERPSTRASSPFRKSTLVSLCRDFLNHFCWFGDFDTGGKSVTSAGIESISKRIRYWLASNNGPTEEVMNHLAWILKIVERSINADDNERKEIEDQIVQQSVRVSFKRVRQYRKWLTDAVEIVHEQARQAAILQSETMAHLSEETKTETSSARSMVCDALAKFGAFGDDLLKLCDHAYIFRKTLAMRQLNFLCEHEPQSAPWCSIRHRIGRLGSWRKAAKTLISTARELPWLVQAVELRAIYSVVGNIIATHTHHLRNEVTRLLPSVHVRLSPDQNRVIALLRTDDTKELIKLKVRSCSRAHVHSECVVAEFFHANSLKFACDDRYIGSSKPPCYCCTLYLKHHPGNFEPRPSHGNVWVQWLPPGGSDLDRSTQMVALLEAMRWDIDQDIKDQVIQRRVWKGKSPDSITNITTPTITPAGSVRSRPALKHAL